MSLYSRVKTWVSNEVLTASDLNAEFDNIINNSDISSLEGYSANVTEMQTVADPGGVGTESLASNAAEEITRLRYMIKWITGAAQWYVSTGRSLGTGLLSVKTADIDALQVTAAKLAADAVETAKIKDLNVTSGKLAADSVIAGKIADGAVNATAKLADGIVTQAKRATATSAVSSSCGSVSYIGGSRQDVTNLSVTITKSGRPVLLMLQGNTSGNGWIKFGASTQFLYFVRTSTDLSQFLYNIATEVVFPPGSFQVIDTDTGTGSTTYKVQVYPGAGDYIYFEDVKLVAVEL
jgi:hypothetical protein